MISAFFIGFQSRGPAYRADARPPPEVPAPPAEVTPLAAARSPRKSEATPSRKGSNRSGSRRANSFSRFGPPRRTGGGKPDRHDPTSSAGSASWTGSLSCFSSLSGGVPTPPARRRTSSGLKKSVSAAARSTWSDLSCFTDTGSSGAVAGDGACADAPTAVVDEGPVESAAPESPARKPRAAMPDAGVLNTADADAVAGWMLLCCGSPLFALRMCGRRPFASAAHLLACADDVWRGLPAEERAAATAAHPRLGARLPEARSLEQRWRVAEHAAVTVADPEVKDRLEELNDEYFMRFGAVFLVCTRGKSAQDVIDALLARLKHSRRRERRVAEREQLKFTKIRLEKLLRAELETAEVAVDDAVKGGAPSFCS